MSLNSRLFTKIFYAFTWLALIIFTGTIGFFLIEDEFTVLDSFYQTVITVSTVGFQEVHPLSDTGRIFTACLIISGFGTFAYAISAITGYLVGGEYKAYLKQHQLNKELEKLDNHVIVCGYGRVGRQTVADLNAYGRSFVILEKNGSLIQHFKEESEKWSKHLFFNGDATSDEVLLRSNITRASALITTLPRDSDNLFVVLSAREINPRLTIISRASEQSSVKKLRMAGANNVIMPDCVGGSHMAQLVVTPDVVEFLDHISMQGEADTNLKEIAFGELPANFQYKTIGELNAQPLTGANIIGFRKPDGAYVINPSPQTEVIPNSKLFVLGSPDQIKKLNAILGVNH